ncbi:MAG: dTDP-4-dehydrorhamnose 3,5-epimerase [Chitinophagia bacterium]|nr:dTDP-4-dehydrorhamnose 3,5-epimerase [Chitinophagia bacterium]
MEITKTPIEGLLIINPKILRDERGYFYESFNKNTFFNATGIETNFVQDNQARSVKNVLRGLHYQNSPAAQTKLLRVIEGSIWDDGIELTADNKLQFYIPKGFAHGYAVLSDTAEVFYKCDDFYSRECEGGVSYSDPAINIDWKIDLSAAIVSEKDLKQPLLANANIRF